MALVQWCNGFVVFSGSAIRNLVQWCNGFVVFSGSAMYNGVMVLLSFLAAPLGIEPNTA